MTTSASCYSPFMFDGTTVRKTSGGKIPESERQSIRQPKTSVVKRGRYFRLLVEMPRPRENISVNLKGDRLTISGTRSFIAPAASNRSKRKQLRQYHFQQSFLMIDDQVDKDMLKADLKGNILFLSVPERYPSEATSAFLPPGLPDLNDVTDDSEIERSSSFDSEDSIAKP